MLLYSHNSHVMLLNLITLVKLELFDMVEHASEVNSYYTAELSNILKQNALAIIEKMLQSVRFK